MINDLAAGDVPAELLTQVCIIGGGVAGQTLAAKLGSSNISSLIIESGGKDFQPSTQDMAKGKNIGVDYYDLETTRLRLFGGTAAIWGGRCAELDKIDFEKRDYLPHSGWPISKADLDPYYESVFKSLGLSRTGEGRLWKTIKRKPPAFDPQKLDTDLWSFDENSERFTNLSRSGLEKADILLNATVTALETGDQGDIRSLTAKSLTGATVQVKAKIFVLAAGAMESVRLLLDAVPSRPKGLGNDNDLVGRFFMEHPHARGGEILAKSAGQTLGVLPRAIRVNKLRYAAYMRPAPELQKELGILNTSISFGPRRHAGEKPENFRKALNALKHDLPSTRIWRTSYAKLKALSVRGLEMTDPWSSVANLKASRGKMGIYAIVRAEQAPNPDSRITLSNDVDALGLRRPVLDWKLSEIDKRSVKALMQTLKEEYQRLGWGDVRLENWLNESESLWKTDPLISAHPIGGYHHMGGTRMSETAATGVVDANCKLHDSPNVFVASSSVFPTSGWANPTITIMALAERLGDHLTQKIKEI